MEYKVICQDFEGPMDLLLHLVKQSNMDIFDISIEEITKQYLDYINMMEELNLNIASEYLVMAAELLEIKSSYLLPKKELEENDEYEENPKDELIRRLLEYERYKNITEALKECESKRNEIYTKEPSNMEEFKIKSDKVEETFSMEDLMNAFSKLLERKEFEKPLNTKITNKEYSVNERSIEIKNILKSRRKVEFAELFEIYTKDYLVVTFLSILDLAKKQELNIIQDNNFNKIYLEAK